MRIRYHDTEVEEITMIDFVESCKSDGSHHALTIFVVEAGQTTGDYIADVCINKFPTFEDAKNYCIKIIDNLMENGFYDMRNDIKQDIIDLW